MNDVADFLRARIEEEEAVEHDYWCSRSQASMPCDCPRNKVLAECAAKRLVLMASDSDSPALQWMSTLTLEWVMGVMALVYSGHPDYREEWRP